jgi:hypothetical protein
MLENQFILEARYLDSIKRVKKTSIVGVYPNLKAIEKIKTKLLTEESKYTLAFSIKCFYNPFLNKIA